MGVTLYDLYLILETSDAFIVSYDENGAGKTWCLPKSQVEDHDFDEEGDQSDVIITEWLAKKLDIDED